MSIIPSWYFVARAQALGGRRIEVVAADRLLELWRDRGGRPFARSHGGAVELCERGPMILAWLGGGSPTFQIEDFSSEGWLPMRWFHLDLPTRPEVVMRDLADVEHFESIHDYTLVQVVEPLACEGASCSTTIRFGWDVGLAGLAMPATFWARVEGLGVQRTRVESLGGRLNSHHLVLPTPRLGNITRVHAGYSVKLPTDRNPKLCKLEAEALVAYLGRSFRRDLARDAKLWCGRDAHQPRDTSSMTSYRAWLEQFHEAPPQPEAW